MTKNSGKRREEDAFDSIFTSIDCALANNNARFFQSAIEQLTRASKHPCHLARLEIALDQTYIPQGFNIPLGILAVLCSPSNNIFSKLSPDFIERATASIVPDASREIGHATTLDKVVVIASAMRQERIGEQARQAFRTGYNKLDANTRAAVEHFLASPNTPSFPSLPKMKAFFANRKTLVIQ